MIWRLFTRPFTIEPPGLLVISDEAGMFPIDKEYAEKGISEGWLERVSYYHNAQGRLVWVHRLVTPE